MHVDPTVSDRSPPRVHAYVPMANSKDVAADYTSVWTTSPLQGPQGLLLEAATACKRIIIF